MKERDERRRARHAERGKGHAHADEMAQLHAPHGQRQGMEMALLVVGTHLAATASHQGRHSSEG